MNAASSLQVGFVGLGRMGAPMALNLARAGHRLTVWNRTRSRAQEVLAAGAAWAQSPADLGAMANVVITMLPDTPELTAVLHGATGLLAGLRPGSILVVMSTVAPAEARGLATRLAERGIDLVDAPVSGGDVGARDATLSIMAGGEPNVVERVRPLLASMGRQVVHAGPVGAGELVKACNQVVVGVTIAALSEALVLAEKAGLDLNLVVQALSSGLAGSRVLDAKAELMTSQHFAPGGRSEYQHKDLGIALRAARECDAVLPVTALVDQLFGSLVATGHGAADHSALIKVVQTLSGPISSAAPELP